MYAVLLDVSQTSGKRRVAHLCSGPTQYVAELRDGQHPPGLDQVKVGAPRLSATWSPLLHTTSEMFKTSADRESQT